jgi:hypothetical protein
MLMTKYEPEQAEAKPIDHRADVWAFGCEIQDHP